MCEYVYAIYVYIYNRPIWTFACLSARARVDVYECVCVCVYVRVKAYASIGATIIIQASQSVNVIKNALGITAL